MEIDVSNSINVNADIWDAWAFVWNVEAMARTIPGCTYAAALESEHLYKVRVERKVGPFAFEVDAAVSVVSVAPPRWVQLEIKGEDKHLRISIEQRLAVELREEGEETRITTNGRVKLNGWLVCLGESITRNEIADMFDEFAQSMGSEINRRLEA